MATHDLLAQRINTKARDQLDYDIPSEQHRATVYSRNYNTYISNQLCSMKLRPQELFKLRTQ